MYFLMLCSTTTNDISDVTKYVLRTNTVYPQIIFGISVILNGEARNE